MGATSLVMSLTAKSSQIDKTAKAHKDMDTVFVMQKKTASCCRVHLSWLRGHRIWGEDRVSALLIFAFIPLQETQKRM